VNECPDPKKLEVVQLESLIIINELEEKGNGGVGDFTMKDGVQKTDRKKK